MGGFGKLIKLSKSDPNRLTPFGMFWESERIPKTSRSPSWGEKTTQKNRPRVFACSQYRSEGWYDQLGGSDSPLSDAILDRIVHDAYKINIESIDPSKDISMREVYGLDKSISE